MNHRIAAAANVTGTLGLWAGGAGFLAIALLFAGGHILRQVAYRMDSDMLGILSFQLHDLQAWLYLPTAGALALYVASLPLIFMTQRPGRNPGKA